MFGVVFAFSRSGLPGSNNKKKALILAGIMGLILFVVPALKYPANPPAVGDPESIYYRQSLYGAFLAISGFLALGLAFAYKRIGPLPARSVIVCGIYAGVMAVAFLALPPNPDEITAPMDLVTNFRIASAFTMAIFWGMLGLVLGLFWDKLKPHESARVTTA